MRNKHKGKSAGERITLALQNLGPVFIKFGQMLSTRRDLLPPAIANELARLQDKVPPFSSDAAQDIIKQALGLSDLSELFSEFEKAPLASASIAQVHAAKLKHNNEDVVVKVLRPDIRDTIVADMELLFSLANVLQRWLPDGKRLRPVEVVVEYRKTIVDELDLLRESANGIQLGRNFEGSDALYVPKIYSDYCRSNVLVMERIYGLPISNIDALLTQNTNMKKLAERGVEVFFTQVFRDSFFHADMHPGNIFVSTEHPENPKYIASILALWVRSIVKISAIWLRTLLPSSTATIAKSPSFTPTQAGYRRIPISMNSRWPSARYANLYSKSHLLKFPLVTCCCSYLIRHVVSIWSCSHSLCYCKKHCCISKA
ncbi:2-polyprenylphenol 6-hydroxylase [marine sediment metagenome]|uniref:2-polyprenylphenol 6-hydroxylase n=1 Tax=marine sediment metagenome TaxID=412755 RepID=A0A1B6NSL9_9ZZZZ